MSRNGALQKALACVTAACLLSACGGGGGGGPTGTPVDDIAGSYMATLTLVVEGLGNFSCPGTMTITQTGNSFSGSISVTGAGDCAQFNSQGTLSGTVTSEGVVAFAVSLPIVEGLIAGCEILSGVTTFTGTSTTTGITATRTNRVRCPIDEDSVFEGDFTFTISGTKT